MIEPGPLFRLRRIKTKKPAFKPQFTEVFSLILNRKSRKPLIEGLGSCDVGGGYRYVIQRARANE